MPNPVLVPPLNFAMVASGVYRSGYPNKKNYAFLKSLKLKSILYLCPEDYNEDNVEFLKDNKVAFFHVKIKGNKEPFVEIDSNDIRSALETILDPTNRPILVHCNKGKHRIGCVIGCLRKLQHWSMTAIFDEYRRFAGEKIRLADQECIELFDSCQVVVRATVVDSATLRAFPGIRVVASSASAGAGAGGDEQTGQHEAGAW
ncbi:hypothetical protein GGF31_007535 [Allomyces arbusculus]|nr:hypothetical protein GGF31_007535 [Allomyces arbusculus]